MTRATTVLRFFAAQGVAGKRLEAAGYADQRPLAPNTSDAGPRPQPPRRHRRSCGERSIKFPGGLRR